MGEAPEVRGFFLGCGFNSAGKRDLKGSSQGDPGIPQPCLASWPCLHPALFPRDDAGRWLWQGIGSLDHPRPAGEGHVRLRHQASHPAASTGIPHPCCPLGVLPRQGWHQGWLSRQRVCPSKELESITGSGFNECTRGVYLVCLIPLPHKQLPSGAGRWWWGRTG